MRLSELRPWAILLFSGVALWALPGCGGDSVTTPTAAEGENEGHAEGEGEGQVEGAVEGEGEGSIEGSAEGEGNIEGSAEGEGNVEGSAEGEGSVEGSAEGEGSVEGEGEGEGQGLECNGGSFPGWGNRGVRPTQTESFDLFLDDFQDGDFDAFHLIDGASVEEIDDVMQNSALVLPPDGKALTWGYAPETWTTFSGTFDYHLEAGATLTFCFRYNRLVDRGYCILIDAQNWTLQRREGQVVNQIGQRALNHWQDENHTSLEISMDANNRILAKQDGATLLDVSEAQPLVRGGMRFLNESEAEVWVDNVDFSTTQSTEETWEWTGGPAGAQVTSVAVESDNPRVAFAGTYGGGLYRTLDGGQTWTEVGRPGGLEATAIRRIVVSQQDPHLVYVGTVSHNVSSLWVSKDAGTTWSFTGATEVQRDAKDRQSATAETYAFAIDPAAAHQNHLLAGLDENGVYESQDGGATWMRKNSGGGKLADITVSPIENRVIWLASRSGGGLLLSSDGGTSWGPAMGGAGHSLPAGDIDRVVVPPREKDKAFVLAGHHIYKTTDRGQNWTLIAGREGVTSIIYIAVGGGGDKLCAVGGGFHCSSDEGATWTTLNADVPDGSDIAYCAQVPTQIYIATHDHGVAVSNDGGATFNWNGTGLRAQVNKGMAIDLLNPQLVYVTGVGGLFRSTDGGASWAHVLEGDFNVVAIDPSNSESVLVGGNAGSVLFRTTDGGDDWEDVSDGLQFEGVSAIAYDWNNTSNVYIGTGHGPGEGTDGGGVYKSSNCGNSWVKVDGVPAGPSDGVATILVEQAAPGHVHVGTLGDGYFYSSDGTRFARRNPAGLPGQAQARVIYTLVEDRLNPGTIYLGTNSRFGGLDYTSRYDGLYKSTDGGQSFSAVLSNDPNQGGAYKIDLGCGIESIVVDPQDSVRMFVSVCDMGVLHFITDPTRHIDSMVYASYGMQTFQEHMNVHRLAISADGATLYGATGGQGVFVNNVFSVEP